MALRKALVAPINAAVLAQLCDAVLIDYTGLVAGLVSDQGGRLCRIQWIFLKHYFHFSQLCDPRLVIQFSKVSVSLPLVTW